MELLYRLLSEFVDKRHVPTLVAVFVLGIVYPFYLLTCYMADRGFYAYERFASVLGLAVPVLFMALVFTPLLLLAMFMLWGAANLYLETDCPRKLVIVPRSDSLWLEFGEVRTEGLAEFRCPERTQ